jgi:formamidopyrimidine-DNA glycosylase
MWSSSVARVTSLNEASGAAWEKVEATVVNPANRVAAIPRVRHLVIAGSVPARGFVEQGILEADCFFGGGLYSPAVPELAEVEYHRRQWDAGRGQKVLRVVLHGDKRVFRETDAHALRTHLAGAVLLESEARGKQMLFHFSGGGWLGVHLGMTGRLRIEGPGFVPGKHDHLVLIQARRTLVFSDPRLFGLVRFCRGRRAPAWWRRLPPAVIGAEFTAARMGAFLHRHGRLPLKGALLLQDGFPGIGNWMADEILWRAQAHPGLPAGRVNGARLRRLWRVLRWVSRRALAIIAKDYSDPPAGWLFNERWSRRGVCPVHRALLRRATVGGRTTVWCAKCQPG